MSEVTRLLVAIGDGDPPATAELLPLVYQEVRRLARAHIAQERAEHKLQAAALVQQAYQRLVGDAHSYWDGPGDFPCRRLDLFFENCGCIARGDRHYGERRTILEVQA